MTKYNFVLLSADKERFIEKLQGLGMVDINRSQKAIDKTSKQWSDRLQDLSRVRKTLDGIGKEAEATEDSIARTPYTGHADDLFAQVQQLISHQENLQTREATLRHQIAEAKPWGDFSVTMVEQLKEMGILLHAYAVPENRYDPSWEKEYPLQFLTTSAHKCRFVILEKEGGDAYRFPYQEVEFPQTPYTYLEHELEQNRAEQAVCRQQLVELSGSAFLLEEEANRLGTLLDAYLTAQAPEDAVDGYISVFTGFVPTDQTNLMDAFLSRECLYYTKEAARMQDNPPVKLKNNRFAKLYEPIGNMYMLPNYTELDLTPYFAPFYMLFFGLCLGDMGYGLLILLVSIFGRFFLPKIKPFLNLGVWLGVGTVLMAALPGSFFGMSIKDLFPAGTIKEGGILAMTNMQMFWFAILFGIFQILFARVLNAVFTWKYRGFKYALSGFGWVFLIIWCTLAYAATMVPGFRMSPPVSYTLLGLGCGLILFFTKTEGNFFGRIGSGLWAFYDITGVFGDMLSYIRLFGLGTAGSILAMVINAIAMSLTGIPVLGYVLGVVLLLFGHTLVFGLNILGAFVHPMRLTFVEFYKNAGFTGGGRPYNPLSK